MSAGGGHEAALLPEQDVGGLALWSAVSCCMAGDFI